MSPVRFRSPAFQARFTCVPPGEIHSLSLAVSEADDERGSLDRPIGRACADCVRGEAREAGGGSERAESSEGEGEREQGRTLDRSRGHL